MDHSVVYLNASKASVIHCIFYFHVHKTERLIVVKIHIYYIYIYICIYYIHVHVFQMRVELKIPMYNTKTVKLLLWNAVGATEATEWSHGLYWWGISCIWSGAINNLEEGGVIVTPRCLPLSPGGVRYWFFGISLLLSLRLESNCRPQTLEAFALFCICSNFPWFVPCHLVTLFSQLSP